MSQVVRRGPYASLPIDAPRGELLVTLDTAQLFMSLGAGNGLLEVGGKINDGMSSGTGYTWSIDKIKNELAKAVVSDTSGVRITISDTAPTSPVNGKEIWVDSANNLIKHYKADAWVAMNSVYA